MTDLCELVHKPCVCGACDLRPISDLVFYEEPVCDTTCWYCGECGRLYKIVNPYPCIGPRYDEMDTEPRYRVLVQGFRVIAE